MNKKWLLGTILVFTILVIIIIYIISPKARYNSLVIKEDKWNKIITEKKEDTNIRIEKLKFNDYSLIVDETNNKIYYSVVDSSKKYNPLIEYNDKYHIVFNQKITADLLEKDNTIKVLVYNNNSYKIYSLIVTDDSLLNIKYQEEPIYNKQVEMNLELFDNHLDSSQRLLKSEGNIKIINENTYQFSLSIESLGRNERDNKISIFGMDKEHEYLLHKINNSFEEGIKVQLFINNKYQGEYIIKHLERRDNFEPKEKNK